MSYQHTWIPMLQAAQGCTPGGIQGRGEDWLKLIAGLIPGVLEKNRVLGFNFQPGQRQQPNAKGRIPTTMEWARRLTEKDIDILRGKIAYSETVPDVDDGFTQADMKDPKKAEAIIKVIQARLAKANQERPLDRKSTRLNSSHP